MGLLGRLLKGGGRREEGDPDGVHVYVKCDHCGAKVHLRLSRQYELSPDLEAGGYVVYKTVVDRGCHRQIPAVFRFDSRYRLTSHEMQGAHLITQAEYDAPSAEGRP